MEQKKFTRKRAKVFACLKNWASSNPCM